MDREAALQMATSIMVLAVNPTLEKNGEMYDGALIFTVHEQDGMTILRHKDWKPKK